MEEPEDKRILVRFPRELADQLSDIAAQERRSLNAKIIYMLERSVERYQRRKEREVQEPEELLVPALAAA